MEIWKDVGGYEGIYEVSDAGRLRSKDGKKTFSERHGERTWKSRILKQKTDKLGYKRISLYKDKTVKTFLVHRLVADAFCDKPKGKNIINHINGKPGDNDASNLEWCDHKENLMHAYFNGMNRSPHGVMLKDLETGEKFDFYSMADASRFLNKNPGYISSAIKRGVFHSEGYEITNIGPIQ